MKKSLGLVLILVLTLSGCAGLIREAPKTENLSTEQEPTSADDGRLDLVVEETTFGQDSFDATVWWYVVVLDNPNEDYIFSSASIDVEALDASGVILDTSGEYTTIFAGKSAIVGSFYGVGSEEVATLNVRAPAASSAVKSPAKDTGAFVFDEVAATSSSYSTTVAGIVSTTFDAEQENVKIIVVARSSDGTIIAGGTAYVERIPVEGKVRFEALFFDVLPADATFEVFGAL